MNRKGFTLAELLLATALMALVLCGLLALFVSCTVVNGSSRNLTTATAHARYILEDIRAAGLTGLEARINSGGTTGWDMSAADLLAAYGLTTLSNESVATQVTQTGDPLGVSVTVNWNDRGRRPRSITLQTAITNF